MPPECVIPVPYVKCVLVLAAVVKRFVDPSVTVSVLTSACVTDNVYVLAPSSYTLVTPVPAMIRALTLSSTLSSV